MTNVHLGVGRKMSQICVQVLGLLCYVSRINYLPNLRKLDKVKILKVNLMSFTFGFSYQTFSLQRIYSGIRCRDILRYMSENKSDLIHKKNSESITFVYGPGVTKKKVYIGLDTLMLSIYTTLFISL